MSRAQEDASTQDPQPDPFAQELGEKNKPQAEPPPIETPQSEPSEEETPRVPPPPIETPRSEPVEGDAAAVAAPPPIETPKTTTSTDDELILDPELSAIAPRQPTDADFKGIGETCPPPGEVKVLLRSRFATDLEWEEREEVWEANQLFLIETNLRTSERLRFSAGIRVRHQFAAFESDTTEAKSTRFELDAMPTAGYADATLTDGLHLRAGYQMMQLGPMDVFSATKFLAAMDLRNGPTIMPEAAELAQIALRIDADPTSWLSLRFIYLPFYQSHLIYATESDYAQFPASRVEEVFERNMGAPGERPQGDDIRRSSKEYFSRTARTKLLDAGNAVFFPDPDLTDPQAALRVAAHGVEGEVGITTGTAIERLPAAYVDPELIEAISQGGGSDNSVDADVQVFYNRFYVFAMDAMTDVGPFQFGVEAAYQLDRTLLSVQMDFWRKDQPYYDALLQEGAWPVPGKTDIAQLTLHGEFLEGTEWVVALEGIFAYSIYVPYETDREWLSLHRGRYLVGGAAYIRWTPSDSGWTFEVSSVVTNGVNYLVAPRIETRLVSELYAEVGAFIAGTSVPSGSFVDQEIVMGYLYEGIDQVFVGLRWLP